MKLQLQPNINIKCFVLFFDFPEEKRHIEVLERMWQGQEIYGPWAPSKAHHFLVQALTTYGHPWRGPLDKTKCKQNVHIKAIDKL